MIRTVFGFSYGIYHTNILTNVVYRLHCSSSLVVVTKFRFVSHDFPPKAPIAVRARIHSTGTHTTQFAPKLHRRRNYITPVHTARRRAGITSTITLRRASKRYEHTVHSTSTRTRWNTLTSARQHTATALALRSIQYSKAQRSFFLLIILFGGH